MADKPAEAKKQKARKGLGKTISQYRQIKYGRGLTDLERKQYEGAISGEGYKKLYKKDK